MDVTKILTQLRQERERIEDAIKSYERLAAITHPLDPRASLTVSFVSFVPNPPPCQEDRDQKMGTYILSEHTVHITSADGTIDMDLPRIGPNHPVENHPVESVEAEGSRQWPVGSPANSGEFLSWVFRVQRATDAGELPPKRNIWLERELEQREAGNPKYIQMSSSFYPPGAAPELTPQEWELIATIALSDDGAAQRRLQLTVNGHFPSELLESMATTFLCSSPELLKYYETADQSTRSRMSLWIKHSVLEMWGALMLRDSKASSDAA
jgi:hypothetical protein